MKNKSRSGFLLAEALFGLTLMAMVVVAATQSVRNAQSWSRRAENNKHLAEEAERLWLEIQIGQSLGPRPEVNTHAWSLSPLSGPQGFSLLKLSTKKGDNFYVAAAH